MSYDVYAESADASVLGGKCCIDFGQDGRVEGLPAVYDGELQADIIRDGFYCDVASCALRVGVLHHVDYSLFDGELHLHGDDGVKPDGLAYLADEVVQTRHFLRVVGKDDALAQPDVALLPFL